MMDCSLGSGAASKSLESERRRQHVFRAASGMPEVADLAQALEEAGAQPPALLANPVFLSATAKVAASEIGGYVREWEDARREACGPSEVVALSDWPTSFAYLEQSEEVLMGTDNGMLAVVRRCRGF